MADLSQNLFLREMARADLEQARRQDTRAQEGRELLANTRIIEMMKDKEHSRRLKESERRAKLAQQLDQKRNPFVNKALEQRAQTGAMEAQVEAQEAAAKADASRRQDEWNLQAAGDKAVMQHDFDIDMLQRGQRNAIDLEKERAKSKRYGKGSSRSSRGGHGARVARIKNFLKAIKPVMPKPDQYGDVNPLAMEKYDEDLKKYQTVAWMADSGNLKQAEARIMRDYPFLAEGGPPPPDTDETEGPGRGELGPRPEGIGPTEEEEAEMKVAAMKEMASSGDVFAQAAAGQDLSKAEKNLGRLQAERERGELEQAVSRREMMFRKPEAPNLSDLAGRGEDMYRRRQQGLPMKKYLREDQENELVEAIGGDNQVEAMEAMQFLLASGYTDADIGEIKQRVSMGTETSRLLDAPYE